jgi:hypothetical protein
MGKLEKLFVFSSREFYEKLYSHFCLHFDRTCLTTTFMNAYMFFLFISHSVLNSEGMFLTEVVDKTETQFIPSAFSPKVLRFQNN